MKTPLKDLLENDDLVDAKTLQRAERRLIASLRDEPRRRAQRGFAAAAIMLLAVGAVALWLVRPVPPIAETVTEEPAALALRSGEVFDGATTGAGEARVEFADDSWAELAPETELSADANDGERIAMTLERGEVTFQVTPGGARVWTVDLGALAVRVTGTRFTVERDDAHVAVSVSRGSVEVSGAVVDGVQPVTAGERVAFDLVAPEPADDGEGESVEPTEEPATEPAAESRRAAPAPWRELAQRGAHDDAYALLGEAGLRQETRVARSAPELWRLADVARLSGHPADAVAPLERLIGEFRGDERRPMAQFTLARLYQERLRRPRDAAALYRRLLDEGVPAGLREPTMARSIDAWSAAGDATEARAAACAYVEAFPAGPNLRRAERTCR